MSLTPFAFWPLVQQYSAFHKVSSWDIEVYRVTETYHAKRTQEFATEAEATAYVARFKDVYPETTGVECTMQPKTTHSTKVTIEPTDLGLKVALAAEAAQDDISYYYHNGVKCVDTRFAKKVVTPVTTTTYQAVLTVTTTDFSVFQATQFTFNNPLPAKV